MQGGRAATRHQGAEEVVAVAQVVERVDMGRAIVRG
jgi:hypothetical protein